MLTGIARRAVVREPMPDRFIPLAGYNAEVWRGIGHTPEFDARMAALQREFDQWQASLPPGG